LRHRAPFSARLDEVLAVTEGILFRRGNFNGTFDQLILNALMKERDAPIAFSPGFRWGTTLLPGESITVEQLMNQTAITYPQVTVNEMSGAEIKAVLEDVADNLFNRDPYYQQGGDMVRVGGLRYACAPWAAAGQRISDLRLGDEPLSAAKKYRVAGWASVAPHLEGEPIYDLVARYLRAERAIKPLSAAQPDLRGVAADPGIA
jgi:S-sulfosulfanyl-L-cysteine sulfohydrolase